MTKATRKESLFRIVLVLLTIAAFSLAGFFGIACLNSWSAARAVHLNNRGPRFGKIGASYVTVNPTMAPERFSVRKGENEYRIFVLGGSQAMGFPYVNQNSSARLFELLGMPNEGGLSTWLQDYMTSLMPGKRVTVINAGMSGGDMASSAGTLEEILTIGAQPDLVVVLGGDNERQTLAAGSWDLSPRRNLDEAIGELSSNYRASIKKIVAMADHARVKTYVLTVPDNIRDYEPKDDADFDLNFVTHAIALGQHERALKYLNHGNSDKSALRSFYIAKCYDALGRFQEARKYYLAAKDRDRLFIRCRSAWNEIVRKEAHGRFTESIDWENILSVKAKDGIPGFDLFHDYCHMKLRANQYAGYVIAKRYAQESVFPQDIVDNLNHLKLRKLSAGKLRLMNFFKWILWLRTWYLSKLIGAPMVNSDHVAHEYKKAMWDLAEFTKQFAATQDPDSYQSL